MLTLKRNFLVRDKALAENEIQIIDEVQRARADKGKRIANLPGEQAFGHSDKVQVSQQFISRGLQARGGGRLGSGGRGGMLGGRGGRNGGEFPVWKEKRKEDEGTSVTKRDTHHVFDKRPKPRN
ncbi:hypothetical protein U1Q18_002229 [Sarracenia purpurea var. burkii]